MKDYSCAQIKKGFKTPINQFPRAGSKVRELFDLFMEYKGHVIDMSSSDKTIDMRVKYLRDFYGMDIRHSGKCCWIFVGEYIGAKYVSYIVGRSLKIKVKEKSEP